jgi:hypothetical protein
MSNYCDYFHPEISQSTFTDRLGQPGRGPETGSDE